MTETFAVEYKGHLLRGDRRPAPSGVHALILHGAGQSHRGRMQRLRDGLSAAGIGSACFDFVGHGETGGALASSSLEERTDQARAVLEHLAWPEPVHLVAASMGAYTAVQWTKTVGVASLVLLVPAMYTAKAYQVPFNGGFTELIREQESWRHSDAWELLGAFEGRLLTIAGQEDRVIPHEVIQLIHNSATQTEDRALIEIAGAGHYLFSDLLEQSPQRLDAILELIAHTIWEVHGVH